MKKITARFTTPSISPEIEPTGEGVKKNNSVFDGIAKEFLIINF